MTTANELLTLDQFTDLLTVFAKNLLPEDDYSRGSDNWKRNRVTAGACTDVVALLLSILRDLMADTAEKQALDRIGNMFGVPRKGAVPASGEDAGLISGTIGATWATTDPHVHTNGERFFPVASGTIGATGQELVAIVAENGGTAGNLDASELLSWESTPTNLETEVELQVALIGGLAEEGDGPYRTRVLNRIGLPAMGGNANDYEQWILESSASIATGYVWPNRNGNGSVDIAGLKAGRGSTRLLSGGERAALQAYVDAVRPVATGSQRVLEVLGESQNCEVTLVPKSSAELAQDWNDSTPPIVSTWAASTRLLIFAADRPASMSAGDRLTVEGTSGVELVIESFSSTDAVVLVDAKGQTPVALSEVYSGGPLIAPVRDAILALFDSLGPRQNEFGTGKWVSTLYHSHLFETVQTSSGVLDSTIIAPASDAEPTLTSYPVDDSTINVLTPGNVLVRYA